MACNCKNRNAVLKEGMEKKETVMERLSHRIGLSFVYGMISVVAILSIPLVALYTIASVVISGGVRVPMEEIAKRLT